MSIGPQDGGVFFADGSLARVGRPDIDSLKEAMNRSGRLRIRLCLHHGMEDKVHEMFIILKKESYVRPHKHATKTESLHILEGRADAVIFDDQGGVVEVISLGDYASGLQFYYRMSQSSYHTLLVKTDYLVFKETADGPFNRADTLFPDWSPAEPDSEEGRQFLRKLAGNLG